MTSQALLALGAALWLFLSGKKADAATAPTTAPKPKPKPKPKPATAPAAATPKPSEVVIVPNTPPASPTSIVWPNEVVPSGPRTQNPIATPALHLQSGSSPQTMSAALAVREKQPFDASYWMPVKKATADEVQRANAILKFNWVKGGVTYDGPMTMQGRRQYRAVQSGNRKSVVIYQPKPPFV